MATWIWTLGCVNGCSRPAQPSSCRGDQQIRFNPVYRITDLIQRSVNIARPVDSADRRSNHLEGVVDDLFFIVRHDRLEGTRDYDSANAPVPSRCRCDATCRLPPGVTGAPIRGVASCNPARSCPGSTTR